jgi:hypothetical protein
MDNTNTDSKDSPNSSHQTDTQLNSTVKPGFFKWVGASLWVKVPLIVASLVVCVAAVFNDGLFAYLFAIPVLFISYLSLPFPKEYKLGGIVLLFTLIALLGEYKSHMRFVYPVIGQKVEFLEDTSFRVNRNQPHVQYYERPEIVPQDPRLKQATFIDLYPPLRRGKISAGSMGYVMRVESEGNGFATLPLYVIWVGSQEIKVAAYHRPSFCTQVKWEFVEQLERATLILTRWIRKSES